MDNYTYELFKELYYYEFDLKDKISNRTNFAFGILSITIGAIVFCYNKCLNYLYTNMSVPLIIGFFLLLLSLFFSFFCIYKSYYGYTYDYLNPESINEGLVVFDEYYNTNKEYFISVGESQESVVSKATKRDISNILCKATIKNRNENIRKSKWLRCFSWSIFATFIVLTINFGIIIYSDVTLNSTPDDEEMIETSKGGEVHCQIIMI